MVEIGPGQVEDFPADVEYRRLTPAEVRADSVRYMIAIGLVLAIVMLTLAALTFLNPGGV